MKITMSEARLNDLVYMTLKKFYFEPAFGTNSNPRECDIRVCMNMAVPQTNTMGMAAAILSPDEVAPASHEKQYEVDTDVVLNETITYLEDHWMKMSFADAYKDPKVMDNINDYYNKEIVPNIMATAEEECAITISKDELEKQ